MAFQLCGDFSLFSDDTALGPGFTFAAMDFQDVPGGSTVSFVNATAGERGLQFPHSGLKIGLPDLFAIRFTGGDNEGSVVSVCVPIP